MTYETRKIIRAARKARKKLRETLAELEFHIARINRELRHAEG